MNVKLQRKLRVFIWPFRGLENTNTAESITILCKVVYSAAKGQPSGTGFNECSKEGHWKRPIFLPYRCGKNYVLNDIPLKDSQVSKSSFVHIPSILQLNCSE